MLKLAPICLFTYNRLKETRQTVDALQNNYLAGESELFIFSDGPKDEKGFSKVKEVRDYLKTVEGFRNVSIIESKENKGLANSIIDGVSEIIEKYGKVIVLEDDLITSPNFLDFMNQSLEFYKNRNIFSISGYSFNLPSLNSYQQDFYLGYRAFSWGWGTWNDVWENVDWEVKGYHTFIKSAKQQKRFMRGGSDMPRMLKKQINGKIDSWAIRWCYDQFQKDMLTIFPRVSKVKSIGFGKSATHTKQTKRFDTILDDGSQRSFVFDEFPKIHLELIKEFKKRFSIMNRLKDRFTW